MGDISESVLLMLSQRLRLMLSMVDMVVDISESVPLMPSQRLMLPMVLMDMVDMVAMVVLDTLATLPLAIDMDSDIMVKYFQSIDDEFGNDLPNYNNFMVL